jgi:hypothetical protein
MYQLPDIVASILFSLSLSSTVLFYLFVRPQYRGYAGVTTHHFVLLHCARLRPLSQYITQYFIWKGRVRDNLMIEPQLHMATGDSNPTARHYCCLLYTLSLSMGMRERDVNLSVNITTRRKDMPPSSSLQHNIIIFYFKPSAFFIYGVSIK